MSRAGRFETLPLTDSQPAPPNSAAGSPSSVSRTRWTTALLLGLVLWLGAAVASEFVPNVILHWPLTGMTWALVGALRLPLGLVAVVLAIRIAHVIREHHTRENRAFGEVNCAPGRRFRKRTSFDAVGPQPSRKASAGR